MLPAYPPLRTLVIITIALTIAYLLIWGWETFGSGPPTVVAFAIIPGMFLSMLVFGNIHDTGVPVVALSMFLNVFFYWTIVTLVQVVAAYVISLRREM